MKPKRRNLFLATSITVSFLSLSANAANKFWVGADGNFDSTAATAGWNGAKPIAGDNANLNTGATVTINTAQAMVDLLPGSAAGSGTFLQTGGAVTASGWLRLAIDATATGNYTLSGGTMATPGRVYVGESGTSTLTISGGTLTSSAAFTSIGLNTGSKGTMNVSSGSFVQSSATANAQDFNVGDSGTGVLTVSVTGTLNTGASSLLIGRQTGSGSLAGGNIVNLDGGTISTNIVRKDNSTNAATFNFNGGVLQARSNQASFISTGGTGSVMAYNVRNGGAKFDSQAFNVTVGVVLPHSAIGGDAATDGGLTKTGGVGVLTLSANNTYTGNTTSNAGSIVATTTTSMPGFGVAGRIIAGAGGTIAGQVGGAGFTSANIDTLRTTATFTNNTSNLGVDTTNGNFAYNTNLTGAIGFTKLGANQLSFDGTNTYTGKTEVVSGTLLVTTGSIAASTLTSQSIIVNQNGQGTGTLTQAGGTISGGSGEVWIGQNAGSTGVLNISAGTFTANNWMTTGRAGSTGTINVTGGTLTHTVASNANGRFSIASGGGTAGTGSVNQTAGAITDTNSFIISELGTGSFNTSGGTLDANGGISMSRGAGTSVLNLLGSGTTTGTLAAVGDFAEVVTTTNIVMGNGGAGASTVNLGGGTLALNTFQVGAGAGTKTVNFNGSLVKARGASTAFLPTGITANVQAGGALINSNTFDITIGAALLNGGGGLTKSGTGILTLTGANTYAGTTTINGGTLQLGTGATGNDGTIAASLSVVNNGALTFNRFGSVSYNGVVSGGGTVTKLGAGTQVLTAAQTYTGATNISVGTLTLDHSGANLGALADTATSVAGAANLLVKGSTVIGSGAGATLSVAGGASLATSGLVSLQDTTINTLGTGGNLTLGTGANGAVLNVDIGASSGTNDAINVGGAVALNGTTTVNLNALTSIVSGTSNYTLITSAGGGLNVGGAGFVIGTKPAGFNQYNFASSTANAQILTINANVFTTGAQYWTGSASTTGVPTDPNNNWGYGAALGTPKSNWSTDSAGLIDALQVPGATTDVVFTASNAVPSAGTTLTTQLDAPYSIRGLSFDVPGATTITSTVLNTNATALSLGVNGLALAGTSNSSATINGTGSVIVNGSQNWANNHATNGLIVSTGVTAASGATTLGINGTGAAGVTLGGVLGNGGGTLSMAFNQAGVTLLNANNTFTGGVALNGGILRLGNAGALNSTTPNAVAFGANSTADLQLNGLNITVGSLNTNATVGTPIVEDVNAAGATLSVANTVGATTDTFAGVMRDGTGAGKLSLTKTGSTTSALRLSGSNTFTGNVLVSNGRLSITNSSGLGVGPKTVDLTNGTAGLVNLQLDSQGGPNISLASDITFSTSNVTGTIFNDAGNNTIAGNVNMTAGGGGTTLTSNGTGTLTMSGTITATAGSARDLLLAGPSNGTISGNVINGAGANTVSISKTDAGTWNLTGTNAIAGLIAIKGGTLKIGGGTTTVTPGVSVQIADGAGFTATMTVEGGSVVSSEIQVGNGNLTANGTLNVNAGGAITTNSWIGIARNNGSGTVNLNGGSITKTGDNSTHITMTGVAGGGTGILNHNSGTITSATSDLWVTEQGAGTYNMNGGGATYLGITMSTGTGTGILNLNGGTISSGGVNMAGGAGPGTLNLNGGAITMGPIVKTGAGTGTVNFNGGTIKPSGSSATFLGAAVSATNVRNGGARVDTNGFNITFVKALTHSVLGGDAATDGGLVKDGAGTLTLSTTGNTDGTNPTGDTIVNNGTLAINSAHTLHNAAALKISSTAALILNDTVEAEEVHEFYRNSVLMAPGVYYSDTAMTATGDFPVPYITGEGTLLVTSGPVLAPLDDFLSAHSLPAGSYGVDTDNDGYNNLAEFILGGIPNNGEAGSNTNQLAPTVSGSGGNHVYVFRRDSVALTQPGLTINYEYGSDLVGWTTATGGMISVTTGFFGGTIDKVEVTVPDPVGGAGFARMNAVYTP